MQIQRHFENSDALCAYVAQLSPTILLSFSLGKDSIGAWIKLKKFFKRIIPFYMYSIPDLAFIEKSIRYFEDHFQTPIIRMPHPALYRMLANFVFQPPERCHIIEDLRISDFSYSYDALHNELISCCGLPADTFCANGARCLDNLSRRAGIKKWGSLNPRRRTFMPIYDWNAAQLEQCLRKEKIKLPVDYIMFGRSLDGIDVRFLAPIAERFPEDYKRILEWFPLANLELLRAKWRLQHG